MSMWPLGAVSPSCDAMTAVVIGEGDNVTLDTLRRLDIISDTLCQAVDAAEFCRNAHSDEAFVQAAEEAVQTISE